MSLVYVFFFQFHDIKSSGKEQKWRAGFPRLRGSEGVPLKARTCRRLVRGYIWIRGLRSKPVCGHLQGSILKRMYSYVNIYVHEYVEKETGVLVD